MPYNQNKLDQVPEDPAERKSGRQNSGCRPWKGRRSLPRSAQETLWRGAGRQVRYAEALEFGEYGGKIDESMFKRLFPFFD